MLEPLGQADRATVGRRRHRHADRLAPHRGGRPLRRGRRRERLRRARARARRSGGARPERRFAALAAIAGAVRERSQGARRRDHRLDREDLDEGHPVRALRAAPAHDRERGQLQHRDRRAADALPDRGGHRGLHQRARDARARADRVARLVRQAGRRRDHERRPGAPRARRDDRERRAREGRADRRRCRRAGRPSCPTSRCSSRTSTRTDITIVRVDPTRRCRSRPATRRSTSCEHAHGDRRRRGLDVPLPERELHVEFSKLREEERAAAGRRAAAERLLQREPRLDARRARAPRVRAGDGRRVAVLGEMAELGPSAPAYHAEIGELVAGARDRAGDRGRRARARLRRRVGRRPRPRLRSDCAPSCGPATSCWSKGSRRWDSRSSRRT